MSTLGGASQSLMVRFACLSPVCAWGGDGCLPVVRALVNLLKTPFLPLSYGWFSSPLSR